MLDHPHSVLCLLMFITISNYLFTYSYRFLQPFTTTGWTYSTSPSRRDSSFANSTLDFPHISTLLTALHHSSQSPSPSPYLISGPSSELQKFPGHTDFVPLTLPFDIPYTTPDVRGLYRTGDDQGTIWSGERDGNHHHQSVVCTPS